MAEQEKTRKELEEELIRARQEAQEQNRAKDAFLANVSHELRTPLNGIIGFGEIISQTRDLESINHYADLIVSESMKLRRLINQLLDISRFSSGEIVLENSPFDLGALKDQLSTSLSSQAFEKGLQFAIRLDEDLPPHLMGDPFRINQIITNLLDNAIRFTPQGSVSVSIYAENREDLPEDVVSLCFRVRDTGIGIPPEAQQYIFDRFSQADISTTRKYGGSGLGMSIAKELVERMGGDIRLESEVGRGTTFWVTLPLKIASTDAPVVNEQAEGLPFDMTGLFPDLRILVVEDYQPNREVLLGHLAPTNADLVTAENGREALQAIERESFDIVLMDIQMPEMDGWEATRAIREKYSSQELPILGITADAFPQDRMKSLDAGMNGVIVKPLRRRQLIETILNTLSGGQPVVESAPPESYEICLYKRFFTEIGDEELGRKILYGFIEKLPRQVEQISMFLEKRDKKEAHRESHSIKGGARNVMAHRLAQIARPLEDELRDDRETDWAAADKLFAQLSSAVNELISYVKAELT